MTTELVLLLSVFAFVTAGAFFGEKGPFKTFEKSGPKLGARLEQNLEIGRQFNILGTGESQRWEPPTGPIPNGKL